MATWDVITIGKKARRSAKVELDPAVFEAPTKPHLMAAEVRRQLAKRRTGTHGTRNRSLVAGGGSKPWRQKGTGRARQGTTRAPQWAGGGVVFGPVPRSHEHGLPKKARRAALRGALTQRAQEKALVVVESIELDEIKTRRVVEILGGLGFEPGSRTLIVTEGPARELERSARNLRGVTVLRAEGLNVYDVLRHPKLVVTRAALDAIQARLGSSSQEGRA